MALYVLAVIFFPGTLVHEIAHAVFALALHLHITSITLFPRIKHNGVILGSVEYYRRDWLRSIVVGVAPVIVGLCFMYVISPFGLTPFNSTLLNVVYLYCLYTVISSMFSSRQDLKDVGYVIPLLIIILAIVIIFRMPVLEWIAIGAHEKSILDVVRTINMQLLLICSVNVAVMVVYLVLSRSLKK